MIKTSKEIYSRLDIEKIPEEDMNRYKKLATDLLVDIHNICKTTQSGRKSNVESFSLLVNQFS